MEDKNFNQLNFEENVTYKKDEKITTTFEPSNDEVVVSKAYFYTKLTELNERIFSIEKDYNEY